jgi:hypothetical protein
MNTFTITTVASAIEHAQEGAQVAREACECDSVLRDLHRLLTSTSTSPLLLAAISSGSIQARLK